MFFFAGAGAERRRRKNRVRGCFFSLLGPKVRVRGCFFPLLGPKVPRGVGARAGPGHLWCQCQSLGWSPPQMRVHSGSLGAKQPKYDVIWGGEWVHTHRRTKHEPRIFQHDRTNPSWRSGSAFSQMLRKRCKNNAKRRAPDPTNPFGNPLGFGLAL